MQENVTAFAPLSVQFSACQRRELTEGSEGKTITEFYDSLNGMATHYVLFSLLLLRNARVCFNQ